MSKRRRNRLIRAGIYTATLALVGWIVASADWDRIQRAFFQWDIFKDQFPEIATQAAKNTLIFTFFGFSGGLALGLLLALMRLSSARPYRWFAATFIELFRGIPALMTILLIGVGLPIALDVRVPFTYGPGSFALAIVAGAYMAETIRAGIEAVPKGQTEAARSLGMSHSMAMTVVVIPQAFRIILPPLTNELVLLLKDTSLLFILGVTEDTKELTKFARDGVFDTFNLTPLTAAAVMYLVITIPLTRLVAYMENRSKKAR